MPSLDKPQPAEREPRKPSSFGMAVLLADRFHRADPYIIREGFGKTHRVGPASIVEIDVLHRSDSVDITEGSHEITVAKNESGGASHMRYFLDERGDVRIDDTGTHLLQLGMLMDKQYGVIDDTTIPDEQTMKRQEAEAFLESGILSVWNRKNESGNTTASDDQIRDVIVDLDIEHMTGEHLNGLPHAMLIAMFKEATELLVTRIQYLTTYDSGTSQTTVATETDTNGKPYGVEITHYTEAELSHHVSLWYLHRDRSPYYCESELPFGENSSDVAVALAASARAQFGAIRDTDQAKYFEADIMQAQAGVEVLAHATEQITINDLELAFEENEVVSNIGTVFSFPSDTSTRPSIDIDVSEFR